MISWNKQIIKNLTRSSTNIRFLNLLNDECVSISYLIELFLNAFQYLFVINVQLFQY
jgi:hypothetical protein